MTRQCWTCFARWAWASNGLVALPPQSPLFTSQPPLCPAPCQVCTDSPNSWMTTQQFQAGLALAQAMPGPLFNFASYLGAVIAQNAGVNAIVGECTAQPECRAQPGCLLNTRTGTALRAPSVVQTLPQADTHAATHDCRHHYLLGGPVCSR